MSIKETNRIAEQFLTRMGKGATPDDVAALFSVDLDFEIAGDVGALPWIGKKTGRKAVADFVHDLRNLVEPIRFEVHDIVANDKRAVILGELASRSKRTGKVMETAFAFVLTIAGGEITHFRMLEDSFAVSQAAH